MSLVYRAALLLVFGQQLLTLVNVLGECTSGPRGYECVWFVFVYVKNPQEAMNKLSASDIPVSRHLGAAS